MELLLCLFIISIIVGLFYPRIEIMEQFREKKDISLLKNNLLRIRNRSIIERENYIISFSPIKNNYTIKKSSMDKNKEEYGFNSRIKILDNGRRNIIKFNRDGKTGIAGTIVLEGKNTIYQVILTPVISKVRIVENKK